MMSAQGGGGGTPKADAVRKLSRGGCVKMQKREGRGSKIQIFCRRHMIIGSPLAKLDSKHKIV